MRKLTKWGVVVIPSEIPRCARNKGLRRSLVALLVCTGAIGASNWTDAIDVRHELKRCVSYRARLSGEYLVIQATHEPGWHTFAMDNKRRAEEKLAGKQSLGVDLPTEIRASQGLQLVGPWHQSPPKEFSRPELQWFSWGFEGQALFAAKVRYVGPGPARIEVEGQACTAAICKKVDVEISLPLGSGSTNGGPSDIDLKSLVRVR